MTYQGAPVATTERLLNPAPLRRSRDIRSLVLEHDLDGCIVFSRALVVLGTRSTEAATTIQQMAGHKDLVTTRYMHLQRGVTDAAIRRLEKPSDRSGKTVNSTEVVEENAAV